MFVYVLVVGLSNRFDCWKGIAKRGCKIDIIVPANRAPRCVRRILFVCVCVCVGFDKCFAIYCWRGDHQCAYLSNTYSGFIQICVQPSPIFVEFRNTCWTARSQIIRQCINDVPFHFIYKPNPRQFRQRFNTALASNVGHKQHRKYAPRDTIHLFNASIPSHLARDKVQVDGW